MPKSHLGEFQTSTFLDVAYPKPPSRVFFANLATYSVQMIHLLHFPMITLKVTNFFGFVINYCYKQTLKQTLKQTHIGLEQCYEELKRKKTSFQF